jgi:hypothetical protein
MLNPLNTSEQNKERSRVQLSFFLFWLSCDEQMKGKVSWDYPLEHVAVVTIFDRTSARPRPWCSSCRTAGRTGASSHFLLTSPQQLSRHSFAAAAGLQLTVSMTADRQSHVAGLRELISNLWQLAAGMLPLIIWSFCSVGILIADAVSIFVHLYSIQRDNCRALGEDRRASSAPEDH